MAATLRKYKTLSFALQGFSLQPTLNDHVRANASCDFFHSGREIFHSSRVEAVSCAEDFFGQIYPFLDLVHGDDLFTSRNVRALLAKLEM